MTLDLLRLMDMFDCKAQSAELMNELLTEQIAYTRTHLMELLAIERDTLATQAVLAAYGALETVAQARILASAEFNDALAAWQEAKPQNHDALHTTLGRILDQMWREDALHRLARGETTAFLAESLKDRLISPMGDRVAIREGVTWHLEAVPNLDGMIALDFDSDLACRHEPESGTLSQPRLEPTAADRELIQEKLGRALEVIDAAEPVYGLMIRAFVRRIIVRKSVNEDDAASTDANFRVGSESRPQQPGSIRLLNPQLGQKSFVACMESMLHECVHNVVAVYERMRGKFMDGAVTVRPVSPWSGNPIPNHSLAHAIFVYYVCHRLFEAVLRSDVDVPEDQRRELARRMGDFGAGFLISQRLQDSFLLDETPSDDFLAAIDSMQTSIRGLYEADTRSHTLEAA